MTQKIIILFLLTVFPLTMNSFAKPQTKNIKKSKANPEANSRRPFGTFENFMGKWDCQGNRTDFEKSVIKDSKFLKDTMTFSGILNDQWVAADYEDSDGYINRCYYSEIPGAKKYEQVCVSSQEGLTLGEAIPVSKTKVEFTGETLVKDKKLVHKKTIERVALGALDFMASIEDPSSGFKREWKALCFFRKADLK